MGYGRTTNGATTNEFFSKIDAKRRTCHKFHQVEFDWIVVIGIGELISGILFLIPRTSSLGLLLLSAHFGGAIATHMGNNEQFIPIAGILVFIWVTALVRDPDTLSSFRK